MGRNIYNAVFLFFLFCKLVKFCETLKNNGKQNTILFNSDDYKFSKFIKKINVTENHKSGVYVDQSLQIESSRYANGMCPVYNKMIMSPGNNYLNYMIDGMNKGFQYPNKSITPTFQKTLTDCAEVIHKTSFKSKSGVQVPMTGIYNMRDQQCYIIAGSYQFVNDSSTCSLDVNQTNIPKCIYPIKDINDYVFLSHNIRHDYKDKCPEKCNDNTEFGKLENGECLSLNSAKTTTSKSATDCAIFLFDNSPNEGIQNSNAGGAIFHRGTQRLTYGVGYNWANYYEETKKCVLYDESPSCINFKKNVKAFVSTAKVNGNDCEPFPESTRDECVTKDSAKCGDGTQKMYTCDKGLCELTVKQCSIQCKNFSEAKKGDKEEEKEEEKEKKKEEKEKKKEEKEKKKEEEGTGFNIWIVIGPLIGLLCLGLLVGFIFWFKGRREKPQRNNTGDERVSFQGGKEKANVRVDYLEEPEESFWEELHNETRVIMDKDY